jgi:CRP-like cAMP-binding protein
VISEGERGTSFFILSSGRVRVEKSTPDGQRVILAFLTDGAFFGEMAILQDTPRTASVIAESKSQILELDRKLLDETAEKFPVVARVLHDFYRDRVLATTMAVHPLFRPFGPAERRELMTQFRSRTFAAGDVLIQQGETGRGLYLLLSGELAVIADKKGEKKKLATLGPGEVFGEMSLLSEGPTAATVTASKESLVLRLDRQSFEGVAKKAPHVAELVEALREDRAESNRARLATPPPFTPGDGGVLV